MATPKKTDQELHPENYFISGAGHILDRIILHESEKIPKEGQYVGLNGYGYLIKPGVEVDIPRPVRKMLDTRIEKVTRQDRDGKDHSRDIPRVTYTLVALDVGNQAKVNEGDAGDGGKDNWDSPAPSPAEPVSVSE